MGNKNSKPTKAQKNSELKNISNNRSTKKSRDEVLAEMRGVLEKSNAESNQSLTNKKAKKTSPQKTKTASKVSEPKVKTTAKKVEPKNTVKNTTANKKKNETVKEVKKESKKETKQTSAKNVNAATDEKAKKKAQKEEIKKQEKATKQKSKNEGKKDKNKTAYEKAKNAKNDFENTKVVSTKKQVLSVVIPSVIVFIIIMVISTIFALLNINNDKMIDGVHIFNIDVSNMTKEEAKNKVNEEVEKRVTTDLVLKHNDKSFALVPNQMNTEYKVDDIIEYAYSLGRYNNIFANNFEIIRTKITKPTLIPEITYEYNLVEESCPDVVNAIEDGLREPTYVVEDLTLNITKGKDGYTVDSQKMDGLIKEVLIAPEYKNEVIDIPVIFTQAQNIDLDKIYSEVHKEAVNASFTTEPYAFTPSQQGLDFDISMEEAKKIISEDKESYQIPLKVLYPSVTNNDIGLDAFPDELADYSTNFASSNANRANNIVKAAAKIDGLVMMPGDEFSFNDVVGQRTAANGFAIAGVYVNGQVSNDYGGGICQVSSTLYNAVLRANLEVTERTNHQFVVGYVPIGTDATVSWGWPDFKFKNNRQYPIKLVVTTESRNVYCTIYGLHQDDDCTVSIVSSRTGSVPYSTSYTTDSSLGPGETRVVQSGSNGARSVTTKILYRDGEEVGRETVSTDYYSPHNQVIARGN